MPEIIYQDPSNDLVIRVDEGYSDADLALLRDVVWGTEGLCYRRQDVEHELARIPRIQMVRLLHGRKLVGVYGLAEKVISVGEARVPALHRMLLAVDLAAQGRGYGKLLVTQVKRRFLDEADRPIMLYGYIEDRNSRSLRPAEQAGYRRIGSFQSVLFSRFHPHPHPAIDHPGDVAELWPLIEEQYADYALCDFEASLIPSEYYVIRRGGAIVAGLQAHRVRYHVVSLAGWYGELLLRFLPRAPYLRRLLPEGVLDYLSVSNIYCPPGHERDLCVLLEGVLALRGLHVAIALLDCEAPLLARLQAEGRLGLLSHLGVDALAHVMAGFNHIPAAIIDECTRRPLLISPLDPA